MKLETGCLFSDKLEKLPEEVFQTLLKTPEFRLERIVSTGHRTPDGEWYNQDQPEWVLLLSGGATLRFESRTDLLTLRPGDYVNIPAYCRHRVECTAPDEPTVWLAIHYRA